MFAVQLSMVRQTENTGTIRFEKVKLVYALHTFLRHTLHILVVLVIQQEQQIKKPTVWIRELLSLSKLMQILPLHCLLQRGCISLPTVFTHWKIIVPTVCLEYKSCKVYQQEFVTLQENIHQVKLCQYSQK